MPFLEFPELRRAHVGPAAVLLAAMMLPVVACGAPAPQPVAPVATPTPALTPPAPMPPAAPSGRPVTSAYTSLEADGCKETAESAKRAVAEADDPPDARSGPTMECKAVAPYRIFLDSGDMVPVHPAPTPAMIPAV